MIMDFVRYNEKRTREENRKKREVADVIGDFHAAVLFSIVGSVITAFLGGVVSLIFYGDLLLALGTVPITFCIYFLYIFPYTYIQILKSRLDEVNEDLEVENAVGEA